MKAARIVTNSPYEASAAALIQNLGWPSTSNLIRKETATLTYKFLNLLAPFTVKSQHLILKDCHKVMELLLISLETGEDGEKRIANKMAEMSRVKAPSFSYIEALARATTTPSQAYCQK